MGDHTVTLEENPVPDPAELSARLQREEPEYMAKWLALEVLITDEEVCQDGELYDKLSVLQEKWEEDARARHGISPAS